MVSSDGVGNEEEGETGVPVLDFVLVDSLGDVLRDEGLGDRKRFETGVLLSDSTVMVGLFASSGVDD